MYIRRSKFIFQKIFYIFISVGYDEINKILKFRPTNNVLVTYHKYL